MNLPECRLPKTHKEIVRIMVFNSMSKGWASNIQHESAGFPSGLLEDHLG